MQAGLAHGSQLDLPGFVQRYQVDLSLRPMSLLTGLPEACLERLEAAVSWRLFPRQTTILAQDDVTRDLLFVAYGMVRVVQFTVSGREIAFADIGPGGNVGEMAAIDGGRRSAYVLALTDVVTGILSQEDFLGALSEYPALALNVMRHLTTLIRGINARVRDLSGLKAPERVAVELLRLAQQLSPNGPATAITIRPSPTATEIANKAATTRETVARTVSALIRRGLLRRVGPDLEIVNVPVLEDYIERASLA